VTFAERLAAHFREQAERHPDRGDRLLAIAARVEAAPAHPALAKLEPLMQDVPDDVERREGDR
jgi:hypothetical protein